MQQNGNDLYYNRAITYYEKKKFRKVVTLYFVEKNESNDDKRGQIVISKH